MDEAARDRGSLAGDPRPHRCVAGTIISLPPRPAIVHACRSLVVRSGREGRRGHGGAQQVGTRLVERVEGANLEVDRLAVCVAWPCGRNAGSRALAGVRIALALRGRGAAATPRPRCAKDAVDIK